MSPEPYEVALTRPARRALAETLPLDVAVGVSDFLVGPLGGSPHRVGQELHAPPERTGQLLGRTLPSDRLAEAVTGDG